MKVEEVGANQKELFNELADGKEGSFLQAWEWGEFKQALGKKVWRFWVVESKTKTSEPLSASRRILALAQVIEEELPFFGRFLYVPHGPLFHCPKEKKERVFELLRQKIKEIAQSRKAFVVRYEPLESLSFVPGLKHIRSSIQALYTLKLDLTPPLEEIMASFKQKTRYNVRLSFRKGVKVRQGEEKDLAHFLRLLKITAERDKF
ncbi:peptidoglycan bridge formation glycyltransferase FemA/FemB family protein, partial [bacterium]|nr:peptidoglycan bridge formation glycyltransferase FemA/FemB family protein [bacterium]